MILEGALAEMKSTKRASRRVPLDIVQTDIQARQAIQERAPGHAEIVCGAGLITGVFAQALEQQPALDLLHSFPQIQGHGFDAGIAAQ